MSEPWQRLLPRAKPQLALMGSLRALCANASERLISVIESPGVSRIIQRVYASVVPLLNRLTGGRTSEADGGASAEPSRSLVVLAEGGRALLTLQARGRALAKRVPEPVQIELRKLSSGGAHVCREIFAGILVVGLIAIVGGYGRLSRGPISLPSLVPAVEEAINGQLSDLRVKVDDAILQRASDGPGVLFRLRNIRLIDADGAIVAQAPLAAIGLSLIHI